MLYSLNEYNDTCQLSLNKTKGKKTSCPIEITPINNSVANKLYSYL